jgi:hypothetical protein
MYDAALVRSEFAGMVAFSPAVDSGYPDLPPNLTAGTSGIFMNYVHPLCSIENIYTSAPQFAQESEFFAWLTAILESASTEFIADFLRMKRIADIDSKTILDSLRLYDGIGSYSDRIIKRGRFVGFMVKTNIQEGLMVLFDQIGMQIDTAQSSLNIYLYHSSVSAPIQIAPMNFAAGTFNWKPFAAKITNFDPTHSSDGYFYIGYYEDDLIGQAIRRQMNFSRAPCIGCSDWNYQTYQSWSKYVSFQSISVEAVYINSDKSIWDAQKVNYWYDTNWGLNLSITVLCDITKFLMKYKASMADAYSMKVALKLLREIAYSTRVNAISSQTKQLAMLDLSAKDPDSFHNRYVSEMQSVITDYQGLSSECLPCNNTHGITYGAI